MLHMKFIADDPVTVTKIVGRLAKFNPEIEIVGVFANHSRRHKHST